MSETEENGSLSFLDITITRKNNKFVTSLYQMLTFSGILINFESYIHKPGLIETLLLRGFRFYSNQENFHREIVTLKLIFKQNNYPQNFVNQYIKKFLNKLFIKKTLNFMVLTTELTFVLPYLGMLLFDLRTRLRRKIERDLPFCKLKIIFRSKCRLNTIFRLGKIPALE